MKFSIFCFLEKILDAFSEYEENRRKKGINDYKSDFFNNIIHAMVKLIDKKEEIDKWSDELGNEVKLLEEIRFLTWKFLTWKSWQIKNYRRDMFHRLFVCQ